MSLVNDAVTEAQGRLDAFGPVREGLADYARLNILPHTLEEIQAALVRYDRRIMLLHSFIVAAEALIDDGYPDLAVREIDAAALTDLQNQLDTITAARARFASNAASSVTLTAGAPEAK